MTRLTALIALSSLFSSSALAANLAGNENYASTKVLRTRSGPKVRRTDEIVPAHQSSISFTLGDDETYLSPTGKDYPSYTIPLPGGSVPAWTTGDGPDLLLTTVLNVQGDQVSCDTLGDKVVDFQKRDDVWTEKFMTQIILQPSSSSSSSPLTLAPGLSECLTGHWGTTDLLINSPNGNETINSSEIVKGITVLAFSGEKIPEGPYLTHILPSQPTLTLTRVYRVKRDSSQAFTSPVIPSLSSFTPLSAQVEGMNELSIPVPSRLYFSSSPSSTSSASSASGSDSNTTQEELPMRGLRVAVKDIYDLKGLKTGCGNRAYWGTYDVPMETAFSIQRIVDLGGIIVGKTKTSQFANGERPTVDWVDQLSPFNPRGDGYQDPSTSSAGSGAAIGAYDWVDITIGSDTGGSVRDPAANQGAYGIRPSHGAIDLKGVMPMASVLDTAGFLTRSAELFGKFGRAWYGDRFEGFGGLPKSIIVPNDLFPLGSGSNPEAQAVYDTFIKGLTAHLGATVDTRSLSDIWNSTNTLSQADGQTIPEYLNITYPVLIGYNQWTQFGRPWFQDYAKVNDGRQPFLDPAPAVRWAYGRDQGKSVYDEQVKRKDLFRDFISDHVLTGNNDSCSDALFLYPINAGTTSYRNGYPTPAQPPFGIFNEAYSPFAETPEISIPLGQVAYNSTITKHIEYLPVSVAIMARRDCDYMLFDLVESLAKAGVIPAETKVGATAF